MFWEQCELLEVIYGGFSFIFYILHVSENTLLRLDQRERVNEESQLATFVLRSSRSSAPNLWLQSRLIPPESQTNTQYL